MGAEEEATVHTSLHYLRRAQCHYGCSPRTTRAQPVCVCLCYVCQGNLVRGREGCSVQTGLLDFTMIGLARADHTWICTGFIQEIQLGNYHSYSHIRCTYI